MTESPLQVHLVIANIQKRHNIRALISTGLALGVTSFLVVGQPKLDLDPHSSNNTMPATLRHALLPCGNETNQNDDAVLVTPPHPRGKAWVRRFPKWKDCVEYLQQQGIPLVGVEIDARAISIAELLQYLETEKARIQQLALVMGNEGQGLSATQMQNCQHLVRLPQYGAGTASYNVYVAASLVLQRLHQYQTTGTTQSTTIAHTKPP